VRAGLRAESAALAPAALRRLPLPPHPLAGGGGDAVRVAVAIR